MVGWIYNEQSKVKDARGRGIEAVNIPEDKWAYVYAGVSFGLVGSLFFATMYFLIA